MVELDGSVWVTNYTDNTLVRVDGATNTVGQTVKVGTSPCGMAVASGKLWVACLGDRSVVEVDPTDGNVENKIDVGGQGWDVQFGFGSIWVPIQGPDKIQRIDPASASIVATIAGGGPLVSGVAITPTQVWVANQGGKTISRIDPTTNTIVSSIDLAAAPFWFAVGEKSILATLSNANEAVILDLQTGQPGAPINVGTKPRDPGVVNGKFWVANQGSGDVTVIDPTTSAIDGSFTIPGARGVFVAQQALGDGWILDYAGTTAYRVRAGAGMQ